MLAVEMLSEPVVVPDLYVSGLAHIEDLGEGTYRLYFYAKQESPYGGEEYVLACKMIASNKAMLDGVRTVLQTLGARCCGAVSGKDMRH